MLNQAGTFLEAGYGAGVDLEPGSNTPGSEQVQFSSASATSGIPASRLRLREDLSARKNERLAARM
jgi:hypothetical protein